MEYDYAAAAKHINALRDKVRRLRQADGTYKDIGLPEPEIAKDALLPESVTQNTRTLNS